MKSFKYLCCAFIFPFLVMVSCGQNKQNEKQSNQTNNTVQEQESVSGQMQAQSVQVNINKKEPFGPYLTDSKGMSLYLFLRDAAGKSTCYDKCAEEWPPLLTKDKNVGAGSNVNAKMLGTVKRQDGSLQVTYNNHPLYYYHEDKKSGDVKGQDLKDFGAEWYLVKPNGKKMGDVEEK